MRAITGSTAVHDASVEFVSRPGQERIKGQGFREVRFLIRVHEQLAGAVRRPADGGWHFVLGLPLNLDGGRPGRAKPEQG